MFSTGMRALCVIFWILAAASARLAWLAGDWRWLVEQVAMALLAVVLWFAVPPGAGEFRRLEFGTRPMRMAFYALVVAMAAIASLPWPLGGGQNERVSGIFVLVIAILFPVILAEHQDGAGS